MARWKKTGASTPRPRWCGLSREQRDERLLAAVSYLLGVITGLIVFLMERKNKFVRFHALQSIFYCVGVLVVWIAWTLIAIVLGIISIGLLAIPLLVISWVLVLVFVIVWLMLMLKAFNGEEYELPIVGGWARQFA